MKRGLIQGLHNTASTICQNRRDLCDEINRLKQDLQLNGYPQGFIDLVINSRDGAHPKMTKEDKPLCYMHIPYVKDVSEKFRCIGNQYNIRTIFKTKHTRRTSLTKTRLEWDPQQMAQCVYSIPCERGRSYIGETGRPSAVWLHEHRHNLTEGLLEKFKLAQYAFEEGHG
jgi:hypothetical protein